MADSFKERKETILRSLGQPDEAYHDLSPKGTVDEGIRELIRKVNSIQGLVTTSSCAGRVSIFLEGGRSQKPAQDGPDAAEHDPTWSGGKGGGRWLFISHDAADLPEASASVVWREKLAMEDGTGRNIPAGASLVHLKFEPMILHILAESLDDAHRVLTAGLQAGFRESGAVNITSKGLPMVAVRSMGLGFDSIIGYQDRTGKVVCIVDGVHLSNLMQIAKDRFAMNTARTERFQQNLENTSNASRKGIPADQLALERELRRQRKREAGLATQKDARESRRDNSVKDDTSGVPNLANLYD